MGYSKKLDPLLKKICEMVKETESSTLKIYARFRFNPTPEIYLQNDKMIETRAYCLLTHAEIEYLIEEIAREIVDFSIKNTNIPLCMKVCLSLLAYSSRSVDAPSPEGFHRSDGRTSLHERIMKAKADFNRLIEGNNGIKEKDMIHILCNAGFDITEILTNNDTKDIFTIMEEYGKTRGDLAHSGIKKEIKQQPSIDDMKKTVDSILEKLTYVTILFFETKEFLVTSRE